MVCRMSLSIDFADLREKVDDVDLIEEPTQQKIIGFTELWRSKYRDGRFPSRANFDLDELTPWFGNILIMNVYGEGADFGYRLVGTNIVAGVGRDLTGKRVSESDYGGRTEHVMQSFRAPLIACGPVFREGRVIWRQGKDWRRYASVHCPLAADGKTVDMTIGVQLYFAQ